MYVFSLFFVFLLFSSFVCPFLFVKISLVSIVQLVVGFFFGYGYFTFILYLLFLITWLDKDSNLNWFLIEKLNCELRICIFCYCASCFLFRFDFLKIFPWTKTCLSISFLFFVCIYIINISRSWIIIICYVTTKMARRTCLVRYHYHNHYLELLVCVWVCVC